MQILKVIKFASIFKKAVQTTLSPDFWIKFVQMSQRLGVNPYDLAAVVNNESGFNPAAQNIQNGRIIAQGLNQLIRPIATRTLGMSKNLWKNFANLPPEEHLKWTEKFFQKFGDKLKNKSAGDIYLMNFGGFNNPDGSLYAGKQAQARYKAQYPDAVFKNPEYQQKAIEQNQGLVENDRIMPETVKSKVASGPPPGIKANIDQALQRTQGQPPPPYQEPNPNWEGSIPSSLSPQEETPEELDDLSAIENMIWFQ